MRVRPLFKSRGLRTNNLTSKPPRCLHWIPIAYLSRRHIPTTVSHLKNIKGVFFFFQKVQPQKRKKKQSIETKATDSNAVIIPQTTSSTIEKLKLLRWGHRRKEDRNVMKSDDTHRNADMAHLPTIFSPFS